MNGQNIVIDGGRSFGNRKEKNKFEETIFCPICNSKDDIRYDYKEHMELLSTFRDLKLELASMWVCGHF